MNEFWDRVDKGDGCWEWQGYRQKNGYGYVGINGKSWLAHRRAYTLIFGPIPEGLCVCHHCDNPPCCNPQHLFLGTRGDNNRDRDAKGRHRANVGATMARMPERRARGERQGSSKLTTEQVRAIRRLSAEGRTQRSLAAQFGVGKTCIGEIVRRENWVHA